MGATQLICPSLGMIPDCKIDVNILAAYTSALARAWQSSNLLTAGTIEAEGPLRVWEQALTWLLVT